MNLTPEDGEVLERYQTLINPESWISPQLIQIHGITNEMVEDSPTFADVAETILDLLTDRIVPLPTRDQADLQSLVPVLVPSVQKAGP